MSIKNTTRVTKAELVQLNNRLAAENEALRAELSALRGDIENGVLVPAAQAQRAERQPVDSAGRRAQLDALKAFAVKFRCLSRIGEGGNIELYSKKRGCWVAVPEGAQP